MRYDKQLLHKLQEELALHPKVQARMEHRSKHPAIVLTLGGQTRKVFLSTSPSDHRAILNAKTELRRILRELEGYE